MAELKVRDLMTTQVITLKPNDSIKQATIRFAVNNISGAPVVDNRNHLVGIISEDDVLQLIVKRQSEMDEGGGKMLSYSFDSKNQNTILQEAANDVSNTKVEEIMTRTLLTTTPDATIVDLLKAMIERKVKRVPVLEKGVLVGIISRGDIVFHIYKRKV
ncbi:MAG TPA: CBS domain-containing protein [Candidatus Methanomethylophilaceae archaeon]|nr:CBS domain-containing protein [Candidatus Methanomethylophilaceae archaeon]